MPFYSASEWMNSETSNFSLSRSSSLSNQRDQTLKVINQGFVDMIPCPGEKLHTSALSFSTYEDFMGSCSNSYEIQCVNSEFSSYISCHTDLLPDQASASDTVKYSSLSQNEVKYVY